MTYDQFRYLADSWGLVLMCVLFLVLVGWTFRKGSARRLDEAANMIFNDDSRDGADDQAH
jgi:cytochrome c oxidase cbb3-type subunit 4